MAFTSSFYINGLFRPIKVDNITIAKVVKSEMEQLGPGCSLNHIDVSDVIHHSIVTYQIGTQKTSSTQTTCSVVAHLTKT